MRQGAAQSAPTSLICTITCIIMLIIVNRIQFSHYSSFCQYRRCVGFASCTLRRIFESASPQGLRCVQSRLMQSAVYFFRIENPDMLHGITNSTRRESHAAAPGAENASISAPRLLGFFCSAGRCTACLPIARGRQSLTGAGRFPACGFQWAA